jgi:hypothetical protein
MLYIDNLDANLGDYFELSFTTVDVGNLDENLVG